MIFPTMHPTDQAAIVELMDAHRLVIVPDQKNWVAVAVQAGDSARVPGTTADEHKYWCTRVVLTMDHAVYFTCNGTALADSEHVQIPHAGPDDPEPDPRDNTGMAPVLYVGTMMHRLQEQMRAAAQAERARMEAMNEGISRLFANSKGGGRFR